MAANKIIFGILSFTDRNFFLSNSLCKFAKNEMTIMTWFIFEALGVIFIHHFLIHTNDRFD